LAASIYDPRRGVALGLVGGTVMSLDVPMIRLAGADAWTSLTIRAACLALLFMPLAIAAHRKARLEGRTVINRAWIEVGILYGISNMLFTIGVFTTSTANLVFILALNPLLSAVFAWMIVGERPSGATLLAIGATLFGVGLIVSEGMGRGTTLGDMAALGAATAIALLLVRTRQSGGDMSLAPGIGGVLSFAVAAPLALAFSDMPQQPAWLLANGLIAVPIAAACLALAPRFITAPQVGMFYLIETVMAPIWVWMVFGETVSAMTLAGGAIVLCAIMAHSLWSMRSETAAEPA
jgi:drug/metabolite transporter (DMT)-like permease